MDNHRPYIDAVGAAVQDHGVPLVTSVVARIAGRAEALLRIDPRITSATFAGASHVDLRWDEERGWRCVVGYPPHADLADRVIDGGGEERDNPLLIADWFITILTKHGWVGADVAAGRPHPAAVLVEAAPVEYANAAA